MFRRTAILLTAAILTGCASTTQTSTTATTPTTEREPMSLGAFSNSLAVKDLQASREFYETLGFEAAGGDPAHGWLILRNGTTTIGLFQGMFDKNIMTFNPGWTSKAEPIDEFEDVRAIQQRLRDAGITLLVEAEESGTGPAHFVLEDPDGNQVMFDQHVKKPGH